MIDRAATIEKFGYDPDMLNRSSDKHVIAICEGCGRVRDMQKINYRDLCISCAQKKRWEDPKVREKQSTIQKKRWEDPIEHEKMSMATKKYFGDHREAREKNSTTTKKYFEDPKAREKASIAAKKYWEDHPEARENMSATKKKYFKDPKAREKNSAAQKKYFKDYPKARENMSVVKKKHYKDHPETIMKLSTSQKKRWEDPEAHKRHSAARQRVPYEKWEAFAIDKQYCPAFNEACRESNREKYGRRCFICDLPESENLDKNGKVRKLSVHHVDMNKDQGCDGHEWKLIPTCLHHHGVTHTLLWIGRITYLLRVGA